MRELWRISPAQWLQLLVLYGLFFLVVRAGYRHIPFFQYLLPIMCVYQYITDWAIAYHIYGDPREYFPTPDFTCSYICCVVFVLWIL